MPDVKKKIDRVLEEGKEGAMATKALKLLDGKVFDKVHGAHGDVLNAVTPVKKVNMRVRKLDQEIKDAFGDYSNAIENLKMELERLSRL